MPPMTPSRDISRLIEVMAALRTPVTGCPWDLEQTFETIAPYTIEEAYEVADAIQRGSRAELCDELGDLLFQVVFHTTLATEAGQFTLADVARGIDDKLRLRHPHVFGDVEVGSADDVVTNWELIKKDEKGRASVFDGLPAALPALLFALKVQKKASAIGVDTLGAAPSVDGADEDAVGELLYAVVDAARRGGVAPEQALRLAADRHRDRAKAAEAAGIAEA